MTRVYRITVDVPMEGLPDVSITRIFRAVAGVAEELALEEDVHGAPFVHGREVFTSRRPTRP